MKKLICMIVVALLTACGSHDAKKETITPGDSTGIENKTIAVSFDEHAFKPVKLPLVIDTNFILEVDTNHRIPYQQIRQLGTNFLKHDISSGLVYDINSFCEIDSIKQAGTYDTYLEKLDIGMTKVAISFKLGVITLAEGTKLFLWGIHNSSYEACPFFAGTTIVGTFVNSAKQNTSFVIAEISGGGDPPSMGNDEVTAKISADGTIEIKSVSVNDDLDIPGEETTTRELVLKAGKDKVEILNSKKKSVSTEKAAQ